MHLQAQSTRQALQVQGRLVGVESELQVFQVQIGQTTTPLAFVNIGPQVQTPQPFDGPVFARPAGRPWQALGGPASHVQLRKVGKGLA